MITGKQLRKKYLKFFEEKGHTIIPSASLIPENDPSTLFISAGMQPIVPNLLGEKHPAGKLLVNSQKCIRTIDIDEVGDKHHHTFFEMLGHWSLGNYFKKEAIEMSYEFLTKELKLNPERLAFSVFAGDQNAPKDDIAIQTWKKMGIPQERIKPLPKKDNWWEPAGTSGPCGPSTEMFYWSDNSTPAPAKFDPEDKRWVEIGNDVLMEYEKIGENKYQEAKQKNIDNGTGLERTLAILSGLDDDYQTELFLPLIEKIEKLSGKKYDEEKNTTHSIRIIADHLKAATFILGDPAGLIPSNLDRGYVLRRLIRRAIRHGKMIGIDKPFTFEIAKIVVKEYANEYPELKKNKDFIEEQLVQEEEKFSGTLEKGLKEFEKMIPRFTPGTEISPSLKSPKSGMLEYGASGDDLFNLYATYGFPIELSIEEIKKLYKKFNEEKNIGMTVKLSKDDEERIINQFHESLKKHQDLSRTASAGKFKGGLAENSEVTTKMHTATHLLLAALRQILGDHVLQKGSNITPERIRFDFSHGEKLTDKQKKQVEDLVNKQIQKNIPVEFEEVSLEEAKKRGAMGVFEHKYGQKVKVYKINDFSQEICGGPHVTNTGELGRFKIKKEESSSAGVRRIKAILE